MKTSPTPRESDIAGIYRYMTGQPLRSKQRGYKNTSPATAAIIIRNA